jgi:hypothetical protein
VRQSVGAAKVEIVLSKGLRGHVLHHDRLGRAQFFAGAERHELGAGIVLHRDVAGWRVEGVACLENLIYEHWRRHLRAGEVSTLSTVFAGGQSGTHAQITTVKHFVCENGTFDVLLRVTLDFNTSGTGGAWTVRSGTGSFAGLHGSGTLTGTRVDDEHVLDEFIGSMRIN